jgi:hypothetical protein
MTPELFFDGMIDSPDEREALTAQYNAMENIDNERIGL